MKLKNKVRRITLSSRKHSITTNFFSHTASPEIITTKSTRLEAEGIVRGLSQNGQAAN